MAYIKEYSRCNGGDLQFSSAYETAGSGLTISFVSYLKEMNHTFSLSYDTEEVFGRNDPIMSYRNTKHSISIAWDVPSSDLYEAKLNHLKIRALIRMLYPRYENKQTIKVTSPQYEELIRGVNTGRANYLDTPGRDSRLLYYKTKAILENQKPVPSEPIDIKTKKKVARGSFDLAQTTVHQGFYHTQTMMENPLIGVKYANLLSNPDGTPLICYLDGLAPSPVIDQGYFTECHGEELNPITKKRETVYAGSYPKVYSLSCNLNILHKNSLGQRAIGGFGNLFKV